MSAGPSRRTATRHTLPQLILATLVFLIVCSAAALAGPAQSLSAARAADGAATSLTIGVTPETVDYGGSAVLSGRLSTTETGAGIAGAPLDVGASLDGATWSELMPVTTDGDGSFSLQVAPLADSTTTFRVVWAGNGQLQAAQAQIALGARADLGAPAVPRTVGRASAFIASGVLRPRHPAGGDATSVSCYRLESGVWVLRATAAAALRDQEDASLYEATVKLPSAGTWRLRAFHEDAGHAATWSAWSEPVVVTARPDAPIWDRDGVTTLPEKMVSRLGARQLVVVTGARLGARTGMLRLYDYRDGDWLRVAALRVRWGQNGLTNGATRRSGTRTTPTGIWRLPGFCFGTHAAAPRGVKLRYRHITARSWWSAENDASYNTWVESSHYVSGEHLADYPGPYEYAISSGYNARPNRCVYGRGTAIFLHVVHPGYSAGCIMLARSDIVGLLRQLDPGLRPACAVGTTRRGSGTSIWAY